MSGSFSASPPVSQGEAEMDVVSAGDVTEDCLDLSKNPPAHPFPLSKVRKWGVRQVSELSHLIFPNPTSDTLLLKIQSSGLSGLIGNKGGPLNLILFTCAPDLIWIDKNSKLKHP